MCYQFVEVNANWINLFKSPDGGTNTLTMGNVFGALIIDIILYTLLAAYIDKLYPGMYGIGEKWDFPIQMLKNIRKARIKKNEEEEEITNLRANDFQTDFDFCECVVVNNVSQIIENSKILDEINIDMKKNEITVLTGHNGAGKSTLMSIITGMIKCTKGDVYIYGINIKKHRGKVLKKLGLCPQENMIFTELTVMEHLIFFAVVRYNYFVLTTGHKIV